MILLSFHVSAYIVPIPYKHPWHTCWQWINYAYRKLSWQSDKESHIIGPYIKVHKSLIKIVIINFRWKLKTVQKEEKSTGGRDWGIEKPANVSPFILFSCLFYSFISLYFGVFFILLVFCPTQACIADATVDKVWVTKGSGTFWSWSLLNCNTNLHSCLTKRLLNKWLKPIWATIS